MKKGAVCLFLILFLTGCSGPQDELQIGMDLRSKLLQASGCSFLADITADYGDKLHRFGVKCTADSSGEISFTITEPETISGITGKLSGDGGKLTFDNTALHFDLITDDQLSPISAPWIFIKTLRSGYITSVSRENEGVILSIDDSYEEDPLRLDIRLNSVNEPVSAEILHNGRRILSVSVANFKIL